MFYKDKTSIIDKHQLLLNDIQMMQQHLISSML